MGCIGPFCHDAIPSQDSVVNTLAVSTGPIGSLFIGTDDHVARERQGFTDIAIRTPVERVGALVTDAAGAATGGAARGLSSNLGGLAVLAGVVAVGAVLLSR